jgi:hypothetical protein
MEIFTRAQWRARGLSARALDRALRRGEVRRVVKGAYAGSDVPDTVQTRSRAVALVRPHGTVIARTTAAWLTGIDVLEPGRSVDDEPIWLLVEPDQPVPRVRGCRGRRGPLPDDDLVEEHGVVRTNDLRTALDLGRFLPRRQAVAALDAFLHADRVSLEQLWDRARLLVNVRNCRRLRANLAVADGGAESYAESEQRVLFIDAGLPRPRTQLAAFGRAGDLIGWLDMGWKRYLVASEYDGEAGHDGEEQRGHDEKRRARVREETPWELDVVRKEQLWGQPAGLVAHTADLLLGRGWEPASPLILEQIRDAADFEARTGERWEWMPLERLLAP